VRSHDPGATSLGIHAVNGSVLNGIRVDTNDEVRVVQAVIRCNGAAVVEDAWRASDSVDM